MAIDLTPRWNDFAVYLPAIQSWYSQHVYSDRARKKDRPFPKGIKLQDLDYLNPKSKLWHYGYGLYSAGLFSDDRPRACTVANPRAITLIMVLSIVASRRTTPRDPSGRTITVLPPRGRKVIGIWVVSGIWSV